MAPATVTLVVLDGAVNDTEQWFKMILYFYTLNIGQQIFPILHAEASDTS